MPPFATSRAAVEGSSVHRRCSSKTDRKQPPSFELPAVSKRATGKKGRRKLKSRPTTTGYGKKHPERKMILSVKLTNYGIANREIQGQKLLGHPSQTIYNLAGCGLQPKTTRQEGFL